MTVNKAVMIQSAATLTWLAMIMAINSNGVAAATIARPRPMSHEIQRTSAGMTNRSAALVCTPNTVTDTRLSGSTAATNKNGIANDVHQAITLIAVVIRVFSKLTLENAPHPSPRVQNWAQYSRGIGCLPQNWAQYSRGIGCFPQNGTQALKGEDLREGRDC